MSQGVQYYFASGQEQRGPFTIDELVGFGLRPDTLVWREGMLEWQRLDSVAELVQRMSPPAPVAIAAPAPVQEQPVNLGYQTPAPTLPASGMAVTSMVLGILALLSLCVGHISAVIGLPSSILAVIFGIIARGKVRRLEAGGGGMATAGLICGIVYLCLLAVGVIIVLIAGIAMMSSGR